MAARRDPRRPMDVVPDIALLDEMRRPGVQAHAHLDRAGRECRLRRLCGCERGRRLRERVEEGVSLRVHLDASVTRECFAQEPAVLQEGGAVALGPQLVEQARRALDVREKERHGSARQLLHGVMMRQIRFYVTGASATHSPPVLPVPARRATGSGVAASA